MYRFLYEFVLVVCVIPFVSSCSKDKDTGRGHSRVQSKGIEETFLDVHFILGSTPEELIERFGEPKPYIHEREGVPGNMVWKDIHGIRVFTVIRDGRCAYVHYTFNELEPFDEEEAFRIVGIERPRHDPILIPQSEARKWKPFEEYDRLTVNPDTKGVAVRAYAFRL